MKKNKSLEVQLLIKTERERQGISIRNFAKQIGCTSRSIQYWDRGERVIGIDMADKALKVLGARITIGEVQETNKTNKDGDRND